MRFWRTKLTVKVLSMGQRPPSFGPKLELVNGGVAYTCVSQVGLPEHALVSEQEMRILLDKFGFEPALFFGDEED